VALQGTIDTFALADVLRLLGSTAKTGRLTLDGDRGRGEIVVVDGSIKGLAVGEVSSFDRYPADETMFELLRFRDASFVFDTDEAVRDHDGEAWEVDSLLTSAEEILDEWHQIETIMPSIDAWVALAPELPGAEVTLDAERWRLLAQIGSGVTAGNLAAIVGTNELGVGRLVRDLSQLGVVAVGDGPTTGVTPPPLPTRGAVGETVVAEAEEPASPPSSWFEETPLATGTGVNGQVLPADSDVLVDLEPVLATELLEADDDTSAAEFARHLASLSPKAAQAVAAAARAETPEERDAALAEVASSDEDIDHDLLLRFLGDTAS
jgi:hypothetical protein